MPLDPKKKTPSASQAELHSVEKQMRLLTPEIQADPETQQKLGEKWGLEGLEYSTGATALAEIGELDPVPAPGDPPLESRAL